MGREIRRVPKDWEHPKRMGGRYTPLSQGDYVADAREWLKDCISWADGTHDLLQKDPTLKADAEFWWDFECTPPAKDNYMPTWPESKKTCYQIYENVSEGTPVSPVFETSEELINWLLGQGFSEAAARKFLEFGYAPSFVVQNGRMMTGIEAAEFVDNKS